MQKLFIMCKEGFVQQCTERLRLLLMVQRLWRCQRFLVQGMAGIFSCRVFVSFRAAGSTAAHQPAPPNTLGRSSRECMRLCAYPSIAPPSPQLGDSRPTPMELRTGEPTSGPAHSCHDLVSLPSCHEDLPSRYCCCVRVIPSVPRVCSMSGTRADVALTGREFAYCHARRSAVHTTLGWLSN